MLAMSRIKEKKKMFFWYVKDFLANMRIELKSERTVGTYRESLDNFRKYLAVEHKSKVDTVTLELITEPLIKDYFHWVIEANSTGTRNIRLAALKSYARYAAQKDMDYMPIELILEKIRNKKVHARCHNWLEKQQILLLLEQPAKTKAGIRDRFIMLFLFSTGARLNEMLSFRIQDAVLEGQYPYVRLMGKGNKPRIVPVAEKSFVENYKYYLSLYYGNMAQDSFLFYTVIHGNRGMMSEDNVQRIMKKYGDMARKTDPTIPVVHPHLLRHSYGAQLYRLGMSLPEIAKLLGHTDLSTTEIYAETDADMIAEAMKKMLGEQPHRKWSNLSEEEKLKVFGLK